MKFAEYHLWTDDSIPRKRRETSASFSSDPRLIEANIEEGVVSGPPSKYRHCCRPVGVSEADCEKVAVMPPNALVSATISRTSLT
jgi:hypothetical protein